MNKSFLISIIVVVVLIGVVVYFITSKGGSMYTSQNNMQPAPSQNAQAISPVISETAAGAQVAYTANGFEPKSVSIKVGQTVTWTNNGTDDVWVASNPHPTHTDYPGFDAKKPYKTGETYSFTFEKAGTWGYHNHLNHNQGGEVVVTP